MIVKRTIINYKLFFISSALYFVSHRTLDYINCTRANIFRQWTIGGKVPCPPVLYWAVVYHGITRYTSANGPLAAVIFMIQKLVLERFEPVLLKKALTEKPYTDAAHRASVLSYYATETSWSTSLFSRCVYSHVGLYRFLNTPLVSRYPVIPWYITAQWSTGDQGTFPPMVHWRKMGRVSIKTTCTWSKKFVWTAAAAGHLGPFQASSFIPYLQCFPASHNMYAKHNRYRISLK